jgi:hypothetical protein
MNVHFLLVNAHNESYGGFRSSGDLMPVPIMGRETVSQSTFWSVALSFWSLVLC